MPIRLYKSSDLETVLDLSIRAWASVFPEIEKSLSPELYREFFPDWRVSQRDAVRAVCTGDDHTVWIATPDVAASTSRSDAPDADRAVGFSAVHLHREDKMGEIYMIAVDPDYQRQGHAAALIDHSVDWMRDQGMTTAMVETNGDPGHAPARATYEHAQFEFCPVARYFKKL